MKSSADTAVGRIAVAALDYYFYFARSRTMATSVSPGCPAARPRNAQLTLLVA